MRNERLVIVNVKRLFDPGDTVPKKIAVEEIAAMEMGEMDDDFLSLFSKEIEYFIAFPNTQNRTVMVRCGDVLKNLDALVGVSGTHEVTHETNEDGCGRIKASDIENVIRWVEEKVKTEDYRRFTPLLGLLKGFRAEQWDCLEVLLYSH